MRQKTILFSTVYSEALKSILPFIAEAKNNGYDVFVANSMVWKVDKNEEIKKVKNLEKKSGARVEIISESPASDNDDILGERLIYYSEKIINRILRPLGLPAWNILARLRLEKYRKKEALRLMTQVNPDLVFVTGDQSPIQKWLVHFGNKLGIPTINYQWNICDANYKSALELLQRFDANKSSFQRMVDTLQEEVLGKLGYSIKFDRETFGGGKAKTFAVIGQGAKEGYEKLGIAPQKMCVVGHPIYEYLHRNKDLLINDSKRRQQVYKDLGIPTDKKLVLWCTNDQRTYYQHLYTYQEMYDSWKSKLNIMLNTAEDIYLLIKIHPGEAYEDYVPLIEGLQNVSIEREYNVWDIVPCCQLMIVRFTSTAIPALCLGKAVISHNYPPIAGGSLYADIGGTIHVNSDQEFREALHHILIDADWADLVKQRREQFLRHFLSFGEKPAEMRFLHLIDKAISGCARGD